MYGWVILQKLPAGRVELIEKTSQFNEYFIKGYNKHSDEGYVVEVDVQYPKELHQLHNNLLLLPEQINVEKLVANWHDKKEYLVRIQILKEALNHGLVLIKVHRTIKIKQKKLN